jgi:hypothetical protein
MPVADAYRFKEDIKGAKLEIFETFGHAPVEGDPGGTVAVVADFLDPCRRRSRRRPIGRRFAPGALPQAMHLAKYGYPAHRCCG